MKKIYIILNDSCKISDIGVDNGTSIEFVTTSLDLALDKFKEYQDLCSRTKNDLKWIYDYSLCEYLDGSKKGTMLNYITNQDD